MEKDAIKIIFQNLQKRFFDEGQRITFISKTDNSSGLWDIFWLQNVY